MAKFNYYAKGECPVCGGDGHKSNKVCRSTALDDGRLKVHCWGGGDAPTGWGYVGDDAHGMAQYIEGWRDRQNIDWEARERKAAAARAQKEKERLGRSLTKERDAVYGKWQDSQRLNQRDRDELARRGLLPNEIQMAQKLGWLRRWERGARFDGPANIPGVTPWGLAGTDGMAIAAPNVDGLIGGFQIKPDDQGDGPKYRWLASCVLRNEEQPTPVFQHPDRCEDVEVWITEGFLKALTTAFLAWRAGLTHVVVVGCGGSNWASAPGQWERILQRLKPTSMYLLPDAGAAQNPNILNEAGKLRSLLCKLGAPLKVKWWGQYSKDGKGSLDPDEVPTETIIDAPALDTIPTGAIQHWSQTPQRQALLVPGVGMPLIYEKGDRVATWERYESMGVNILDTSEAGSGKSRDSGEFLRSIPAGRQRVFASQEYRNPTCESLAGFPEMEAKHLGLVANEVDGLTIRRTLKPGEEPNIDASCLGAAVFHKAAAKGIDYRAGLGCPTCEACPAAQITMQEGEIRSLTCAHLDRKRDTKDQPAYVTHPSNIAKPSDRFDAQTVVADEATPAIKAFTQQGFNPKSIARDFKDLKRTAPAIAHIIDPLVDAPLLLLPKLSASTGNEDYWGKNSYELSQHYLEPAITEVEARLDAHLAQPRFDVAGGDKWRWLANKCDLPAFKLKPHHWGDSFEDNLWALDNLARSRFFGQLIMATQGSTVVATAHRNFDANGDRPATLQLTRKNSRVRQQFAASDRTWILLDATGNPWELRRRTGQPLFWIKQRPSDFSQLTIKVITGCDALKVNREDSAQERAILLATAIQNQTPGLSRTLIDYQRHSAAYDGLDYTMLSRHVESRGTNRAKDTDVLLLMGLGIANIGQQAIEYELLTGRSVPSHSDHRFRAWVNRQSRDLAVQEISRLRAQWSDTPKTAYVAGADKATAARLAREFPGATIEIIDALKLDPDCAGDKPRRTANHVTDTATRMIKEAYASGAKQPTKAAIAKEAGVCQKTVNNSLKLAFNQGFKEFRKRVILLLDSINSEITCFENGSDLELLRQELDAIGCAHHFGAATNEETLEALEREFKRYGKTLYWRAIGGISPYGRAGIESAIAAVPAAMVTTAADSAESPPPPPIPISPAIA